MNAKNNDSSELSHRHLQNIINSYINLVRQGLYNRWKLFNLDLSKIEFFEVVGGLMARQANLTIQFAMNPGIWSPHLSPLVYRAQVDVYINLHWILHKDSLKRSQEYILYGLGQEKLQIEHLMVENEINSSDKLAKFIEIQKQWLNDQLWDFFTEVNVGSWSGISVREMAQEIGCTDLYNFAYTPFSFGVHSMWPHIARHDLKKCKNPIHKKHRMPSTFDKHQLSFEDLIISAKYIQKLFILIDKKFHLICRVPLPLDYLYLLLSKKPPLNE